MSRLILCTLLMVTPMILTSYTRANSSFKVSKDEQVKVDLGKNFEMYVMQDGGKKVTVMYDFNKRLTLIKLPGPQSFCILRASTGDASRPAALQKALKSLKKNSKVKVLPTTKEELTVGRNVSFEELSHLSKEMADLCKNLPIKWAKAGRKNDIEQVQDTGNNRLKRACTFYSKVFLRTEYKRICTGWFLGRRCGVYAFQRYTTVRYRRCD